MAEQEKELERQRRLFEQACVDIEKLKAELRDQVLHDPAVCMLKVSVLVDSQDPARDCSRLRNALEGMIAEDMKQHKDGWLMDEGAVRVEVSEAGCMKFDIPGSDH